MVHNFQMYNCTRTQEHSFQSFLLTTWLPGLGYENPTARHYNISPGDIVTYGGYSYTALTAPVIASCIRCKFKSTGHR